MSGAKSKELLTEESSASGVAESGDAGPDNEKTVADLRRGRQSGPPRDWLSQGEDGATQTGAPEPTFSQGETTALAPEAPSASRDSDAELTESGRQSWEPPPLDSLPPPSLAPPSGSPSTRSTTLPTDSTGFQTTGTTGSRAVLGHEALRQENEERAVTGLRAIAVFSLIGAVGLQFAPDKPVTHYPATAAVVFMSVTTWIASILVRRKVVSDGGPFGVILLVMTALVNLALTAHLGVISPMPMALAVLVHFEGSSDHRARGIVTFSVAAVGYFALVILAFMGIIKPLLPISGTLDPRSVLLFGLLAEGLLITAYTIAVIGRKRTLEAMARLENAQKEIRRRQALLDEARGELDRALDVARAGRFTGQAVGPYLAEDVIGRGGMGEVYRAVRPGTGEIVALKILHSQYQGEKSQLERFFREAEATSQLDSPHIVKVLDRGNAPDGSPFLVMEHLVGYDLAQALRKHSRLGINDAITMVTQVAAGLSTAQESGIVHRDVKPQNVFRARYGSLVVWKVLDFGVSKMGDVAGTLTHGAIVGTPGYMSPEQARGKPVDHRSDVFSLAVLAYRALTGRPPFHSPDPLGTAYQVVHAMPVRPTDLVKLDEDVDLALAIGLAKDREDRFRSTSSFAAALRDASRGELDERLRAAARDLLRHHPWGTERRA